MENAVKTKELKVGYDEHIVVPNFDATFIKGKVTSIIGPNGCGKSTVLKAIGRILKKSGGQIFINDKDISDLKSKDIAKELAILPQSPSAPGSVTCYELVAYGRYPYQKGFGKLSEEDKRIIEWALEVTNMGEFASREIGSLSGGQRQRVWISMALAQQTDIIFLDEPTTYLDLNYQLEILELLKKLNDEQGITVVMVLHDLNLASKYSDYLIAMKDGEIVKFGTPKEVITKEILGQCFKIDADIKFLENEKPVCFNYELLRMNKDSDEANLEDKEEE